MSEVRDPHRTRTAYITLGALVLVALVAFVVMYALAPTENANGQCSGIGWGCTLTPRDTLVFLGMFVGIPALLGTLILGAVAIAAFVRWTPLLGWLVGILAALLAAGVSLATVALVLFVF
ncbi:hypothetical protein GCM10010922_02100 [Microbacterium sorbitolivorans]|uniref:Uncharacterized protein n=1 Tax=Microbacterium sorbitolivorans TaxID=1867410 RepID=A0A367Y998_9MICO|nr:hypothetical protein [Microbacterium sorbitolivorans]RCK61612.1 hypothetical protein DTO57_02980 [Microbacterium sorbitolivorans]GGF30684.1 hypothetical protein GCM10010922_02100 [Microbacterium sorbitolivorans]